MNYELKIALKYITQGKKHGFLSVVSLLSVLGISLGVMTLIIALALMTGLQEDVQRKIAGANPHFTLWKNRGDDIENFVPLVENLEGIEGVTSASPVIFDRALIVSEKNETKSMTIVKGIDPDVELERPGLPEEYGEALEKLKKARESRPTNFPLLLLGSELARELRVREGDVVTLLTSMLSLSPFSLPFPKYRSFVVGGLIETGFYEYDAAFSLLSFREAQNLLGMKGAATAVEVRISDIDEDGKIRKNIEAMTGGAFFITDWRSQNSRLFSAFRLEKLLMFISIGLIVVVASFSIVITLILIVREKTKDIGILMSMGATPKNITGIFIIQGLALGLIGTVLGTIAGAVTCAWLDWTRIIALDEQVYFISHLPFKVRLFDLVLISLLAVGVSFLATIYPSWKASRLDPVKALRHG